VLWDEVREKETEPHSWPWLLESSLMDERREVRLGEGGRARPRELLWVLPWWLGLLFCLLVVLGLIWTSLPLLSRLTVVPARDPTTDGARDLELD
jgi:hypothetical protein